MSRPNVLTPEFIESKCTPVPESGCWLWDGYIKPDGYGFLRSFTQKVLAHRASYIAHIGPIPDNMVVRHKCDVRCCVNPNHLELGTSQDNVNDRNERGRTARGHRVSRTRLSDDDVRFIRQSYMSDAELSDKFKIQKNYVTRIKKGIERPYVK